MLQQPAWGVRAQQRGASGAVAAPTACVCTGRQAGRLRATPASSALRCAQYRRTSTRSSGRLTAVRVQAFFKNPFGQKEDAGKDEEEDSTILTPPFTSVKRTPAYELRVYGAYTAATTEYNTRPEGLGRVSEYFDGGNAEKVLLAPTQPLVTRYQPLGKGLLKYMELMVGPRRDGAAQAVPPASAVDGVSVVAAGAEAVAVVGITGNVTPETAAAVRQRLVDALAADGIAVHPDDAEGGFRLAQYGPMYSLKPRKNELLVKVKLQ